MVKGSHDASRLGSQLSDELLGHHGSDSIDCGPGYDTARVRWMPKNFKLRNCERVRHFCAFGSRPDGGCYKPGEKPGQ
jgi:hypothetical protein